MAVQHSPDCVFAALNAQSADCPVQAYESTFFRSSRCVVLVPANTGSDVHVAAAGELSQILQHGDGAQRSGECASSVFVLCDEDKQHICQGSQTIPITENDRCTLGSQFQGQPESLRLPALPSSVGDKLNGGILVFLNADIRFSDVPLAAAATGLHPGPSIVCFQGLEFSREERLPKFWKRSAQSFEVRASGTILSHDFEQDAIEEEDRIKCQRRPEGIPTTQARNQIQYIYRQPILEKAFESILWGRMASAGLHRNFVHSTVVPCLQDMVKKGCRDDEIYARLREFVVSNSLKDGEDRGFRKEAYERKDDRVEKVWLAMEGHVHGSERENAVKDILDIGCSEGNITAALGRWFDVDPSRTHGCDVRDVPTDDGFVFTLRSDDEGPLPYKDNSFDLVTFFMALHHMRDLPGTIREAKRVLRPGGVIVIREHDCMIPEYSVPLDVLHSLYALVLDTEDPLFLSTYTAWYRPQEEYLREFSKQGMQLIRNKHTKQLGYVWPKETFFKFQRGMANSMRTFFCAFKEGEPAPSEIIDSEIFWDAVQRHIDVPAKQLFSADFPLASLQHLRIARQVRMSKDIENIMKSPRLPAHPGQPLNMDETVISTLNLQAIQHAVDVAACTCEFGRLDQFFKSLQVEERSQLMLDLEATWSVSSEVSAKHVVDLITERIGRDVTVVDAFSCVGGNTAEFARQFSSVIACELSPIKMTMLISNMTIMAPKYLSHIRPILGDCTKTIPKYATQQQPGVIFADPPWGGTDYKKEESIQIRIGAMTLGEVVGKMFLNASDYVVLKLPKNHDRAWFDENVQSFREERLYIRYFDGTNILLCEVSKQELKASKVEQQLNDELLRSQQHGRRNDSYRRHNSRDAYTTQNSVSGPRNWRDGKFADGSRSSGQPNSHVYRPNSHSGNRSGYDRASNYDSGYDRGSSRSGDFNYGRGNRDRGFYDSRESNYGGGPRNSRGYERGGGSSASRRGFNDFQDWRSQDSRGFGQARESGQYGNGHRRDSRNRHY